MDSSEPNQQTVNATNSKPAFSYSQVSQSNLFPKKVNAVVIDSANSAPIVEFIQSLAKVINPSQIRFASKISNNRLCIYLASKEVAEELVKNNTSIKVADQVFPIMPLISSNKRIILSNVCPIIPHHVLEDKLLSLGVKTVAPMSFLRAGFNQPNLSHILSFRRQTFVRPEDERKLPESFQVIVDGLPHWIYLTSENPACFLCKQSGHLAKNCPSNDTTNQLSHNVQETIPTLQEPTHGKGTVPINPPNPPSLQNDPNASNLEGQLTQTDFPPLPSPAAPTSLSMHESTNVLINSTANLKRPLSSTNSIVASSFQVSDTEHDLSESDSDISESETNDNKETDKPKKITNRKPKKTKTVVDSEDEYVWIETKKVIENENNVFPLSFTQFLNFLDRSKGPSNTVDIAKEYTEDLSSLISMMKTIYPTLPGKGAKNRCSRIMKSLKQSTSK